MSASLVLLIAGGYLLGSVPVAYLIAKWSRGMDIRKYGSGNVGTTNLLRLTSRKTGIPMVIFDLGKGMLMVWAAQVLGLGIAGEAAVGLAVVTGHNWPLFLRFNGGRGILTVLGIAIILPLLNGFMPWEIIISLALTAAGAFIIHNLPLGVFVGVTALPLTSWAFDRPLSMTLAFLALFLIVVIRRLTAPRSPLAKSVSRRQLIINRLLFDRDIRDRETWLKRAP
ncbi:MAG: glycerol-3-phosphate acyltransferase [Chloroflexota bacterium]|nr:glycerol-3-phosphate acyltransferase [Chloroflexota bacterium]